jgi:S-methylmethionine-dependent homocysteine/selenocysteine methylase
MEAAVVERVRRRPGGPRLHPRLANATLVLEDAGRAALEDVWSEYLAVASRARVPIALCAPTWRANRERLDAAADVPQDLNRRAVAFVRDVIRRRGGDVPRMPVGGLLGCRGDAYRPEDALGVDDARRFHAWQADALATAGVDFLLAATIPSVDEASGLARALTATGVPAFVSFVLGRDGHVLDGTPLPEAIARVDAATSRRPLDGFGVNCAHPTFVDLAEARRGALGRLRLVQANASALDHADLDGAPALRVDDIRDWATGMLRIRDAVGPLALGGCCGTDARHLEAIVSASLGAGSPGAIR